MTYAAQETSPFSGQPIEAYLFTMGASTWRFTSAERDQTVLSATYTHDFIKGSEQVFSREDAAQSIEVRVKRTNPVAALFIAYTPIAPVSLTIYRKHRSDAETIAIFIGSVVGARLEGAEAILICAPVSSLLGKRLGIIHQPTCNWATYGIGCGVDKNTFKETGTVLTASGAVVTATAFGTPHPAGWFRNGWAELPSGDRRFIVDHVGTAITLIARFPALNVGDTLYAFAGDDRTEAVCKAKFNNLVNFSGFARVPSRNPFAQNFT